MNIEELRRVLEEASGPMPITAEVLSEGGPGQKSMAEVKKGLLDWLDEYNTPGRYDRKHTGHDARFCYQHLQYAVDLLWIAEAVGVEPHRLTQGVMAIRSTEGRPATLAAAFRRACPWELVEQRILHRLDSSS